MTSSLGPPPGAEGTLNALRMEHPGWVISGRWRDDRRIGAWLCTAQRRRMVPGHGEADEPNYLIHWEPTILRVMLQRSEQEFPVVAE